MTGEALVGGGLGYLAASISFWMASQGRREQLADLEARYDAIAALLRQLAVELEDRNLARVDRGPDGNPRAIELFSHNGPDTSSPSAATAQE